MADDFSANTSTTGRLIFDSPASGTIEVSGDNDWFRMSLAAGQKIQCNLDGSPTAAGTLDNPYLRGIYDSRGNLIPNTSNDNFGSDASSQVTYTVSSSGDYYIAAGAAGSSTGTYTLLVTDMTSRLSIDMDGVALAEGNSGSTTFSFTVNRDGDDSAAASATWTVSSSGAHPASANDFAGSVFPSGTVQFAPDESSVSVDVMVQGDLTSESDEGFKVSLSHPVGAILGTFDTRPGYTASSYSDAGVSERFYTLTGSGGSFSLNTDPDAIPARADIYVNGVLKAGSSSYLPFSGSLSIPATTVLHADDLIEVVLTGVDGQTQFNFTVSYAPGLREANFIAAATIINDEPVPDDYFAGSATTGVLAVGRAISGRIESAGDNDWFGIRLVAGESYLFNLDAAALNGISDPYLQLFGSSGILIISDDDRGAGSAAQIAYTATVTGTYYLAASSTIESETGQYQLYAARYRSAGAVTDDYASNTASGGRVTAGGPAAAGKIEARGDTDWFAVNLIAGQEYTFNLETAKFSPLAGPHLDVFSQAGILIDGSDAASAGLQVSLTLSVAQSGAYYLSASSTDLVTGTGSYLLSVDASGPAPVNTGSTAPHLVSLSSRASTMDGVANIAIVATFDKPIERGIGGIFITSTSGALIEGLDVESSSRLTVSGATATVLSHEIVSAYGQDTLIFAPGTFEDLAGHSWEGNTGIRLVAPLADTTSLLFGTTGNDVLTGGAGLDIFLCAGSRSDFTINSNAKGSYSIRDKSGATGTDALSTIEKIQFDDVTVNLTLQSKAAAMKPTDLNSLIELYIAYINRVPDADGLSYWIDQFKAGKTLVEIGNSFYSAAVQYSSLTGYSSAMTNAEFVIRIYENVLARSGATAPPAADVNYWANNLATGVDSRGSLVKTMLSSAHMFKGDLTWGWVANLLDHKVEVAHIFAIDDGLSFNTAEDSISHGMAIAAAVTANDISHALTLIGVTDPALPA